MKSGPVWSGPRSTEYREVMRLLLEQGADPDTSHGGETPLMAAAGSASPYVRRANGTHDHAPAPDDAATVELLLRHGAHPDLRNPAGASALMLAAAAGSPGVVRALATAGADLNARDQRGETALYRAASEGNVACVDALLIAGADVNPLDSVKVRPVTRACQKGHGEIVARLLAHGADPNDSIGLEDSLRRAEAEGHTDVAQALRRYSSRTRTTGLW
jgi:ankyrin repeat protein